MRTRTLILFVLSVSCGLVAAVIAARLGPQPNTAAAEPKVQVLVAQKPIARGASLQDYETLFTLTEMPRNVQLPPNYVNSFGQLKEKARDHLLEKSLKPGEILSLDYLVDRSVAGPAATLRPGYTAFAVRVTADSAVNGLIKPHDFVKVIGFRKNRGEKESYVLMKNIRVVAVDRMWDPSQERLSQVPTTIALEVIDDEAKKLKEAQEHGALALGLMALADVQDPADREGEAVITVDVPAVTDAKPEAVTVSVLVAREYLPVGSTLQDHARVFVVKQVPRDRLRPGHAYFASPEQLDEALGARGKEHVLQKSLLPNTPLAVEDVIKGYVVNYYDGGKHRQLLWNDLLGRFVELASSQPASADRKGG